ncbi:hypothetical protein BH11PLA2_BH11PLA2_24200 [soil metagenome]
MRSLLFTIVATVPIHAAETPVFVTANSTMTTGGGQIREFAFDGDEKTFFKSAINPAKDDTFTLTFDTPVTVKAVKALTGQANQDHHFAGDLDVSIDGIKFTTIATFKDGTAEGTPASKVKAVRLRVTATMEHPLIVREFTIVSDPPVAVFKYPVEFTLDVADAPELKVWATKAIRVCERHYFMINEELKSDDYKPRTVILLSFKKDYKGVAEAGGGRIKGSVDYFKKHPDDVGALVHETAHVVQNYRTRNNPGWLVEGIADYIRFYKYEANKPKPLSPERAKFDGSYRTTAAFLDYLATTHNKEIVKKLNTAMRDGEYSADLFKKYTTKPLAELDEDWKKSLRK